MKYKNQIKICGKIMMYLSVIFIVKKLMGYDLDVPFTGRSVIVIIGCSFFHSININLSAVYFKRLLEIISREVISQKSVSTIYCKSNLYKYLPGNVMHFVGRSQISFETKSTVTDVTLTTVLEMIALVIGGMIIAITVVLSSLLEYIKEVNFQVSIILIGFAVICSIFYINRKKLWSLALKYKFIFSKEFLGKYIVFIILSGFRLTVNAVIFLWLMHSFSLYVSTFNDLLLVVGYFVMSWVIGFITPGAPGGLGVREVIMTVFMNPYLPEDELLVVLVVYRFICVIGDVMAFVNVKISEMIYSK